MNSSTELIISVIASILVVVIASARFKLNPFFALIFGCFALGLFTGMPLTTLLNSITNGFGSMMATIGLIVVFGCIIGTYLEKSGAANAIAQHFAALANKRKTLPAITMLGAVISIPVFCDSGFILLSGITRDLAQATHNNKAVLNLGLASGLYTSHTLIPPTPGPIATAGNLGAMDALGTIILLGALISIPVLLVSIYLARYLGKNLKAEELIPAERTTLVNLPKLYRALLPLIIPVILITGGSLAELSGNKTEWISFFCNPIIALLIGAGLAMFALSPGQKTSKDKPKDWVAHSLKVAGPILIITAAGGAFGEVLKATPLASEVSSWLQAGTSSSFVLLALVFGLASVLKTAQGSSTSAMIITSSILVPLLPVLGWNTGTELALAVLAIGGGAMTVSHLNDSYFWVVSQFSGLQTKDTLKSYTLISGVQGFTVLIAVLILNALLI